MDVERIISEFRQWLQTDEGRDLLGKVANEKQEVKDLMMKLEGMDKSSDEFTNWILYGLLPHGKSKYARRTSTFPVTRNAKKFLNYGHTEEDWNAIANMVYELVYNFHKEPEKLEEHIEKFTVDKKLQKGVQTGFITPILFCINDDYPMISGVVKNTYKDFASANDWKDRIDSEIERYPDSVKKCHKLIDFLNVDEFQDLGIFNTFCYWYDQIQKKKDLRSNTKKPDDVAAPEMPSRYSIKDIMKEGCFVKEPDLRSMIETLEKKKNIILQGPPGTGKTFLAKKLAFALIGSKHDSGMRVVQFHANFSYEDFVRGWRPGSNNGGSGGLVLVDGPLLKMIDDAKSQPGRKFVMVIEEINRGNPANIFGEMLTLLEADKRKPEEALTLSYEQKGDESVYVPENLYIIGTMNVADRSIALVDLALRRRFGFFNLEPVFDKVWKDWVRERCGIENEILNKIGDRLRRLNETIEKDGLLGPHFKVGHSYVTPDSKIADPEEWFKEVVKRDIGPLLDEYWIERPEEAKSAKRSLLEFTG